MKKILWLLAALAIGFGGVLLYNPPAEKAQAQYQNDTGQAADYTQQKKKKKTKKNYRSLTSTTVSGDETNGDVAVLYNYWLTYQTFYYRRVPVPGLSLADPFPLQIERKSSSITGFEEEHWSGMSNYFISEGNVWLNYGYRLLYGPTDTTSFTSVGDHRIFSYNGGTRKKATKRKALSVIDFSISGDESNADATAVLPANPTTTYYYRKVSIPGLRVANLGDYRIMQKNPYFQGISEEYWAPAGSNYFLTDDYLYVAYGSKYNNSYSTIYPPFSPIGDYRFYLYSDRKIKKKKLTKQYVKRYAFNIPGGESAADKAATFTSGPSTVTYYYKKATIPGLRMANHYNMKVMKKNSYLSGFSDNLWSEGIFSTTDGAIWILYGMKLGSSPYIEIGAGDYQVFLIVNNESGRNINSRA
jgi:hypothetical protein